MNQHRIKQVHWLRWLFIGSLSVCLVLIGLQQYQHYQLAQSVAQARTVKVRQVNPSRTKAKETEQVQPTYWDEDSRGITVGKLAIPSVGIQLPIIKGIGQTNGEDNMLKAAVTNKEGQEMGKRNYVLSSHQIAQANLLFSPLAKTEVGAAIYLTDTKNIYTYRAISKRTVKADQVNILDDVPGKRLVTLYTCAPDGELVNGRTYERTVIVGQLVKTQKATAKRMAVF